MQLIHGDCLEKMKDIPDKSLDHIKARSQNGSLLVGNLQFISWLENRAKIDIEQEEWNKMKERIYDYF